MATTVSIGGADTGELFIGEDKVIELELLDDDPDLVPTAAPVNMAGWTMVFDVRKKDASAAPALITKTPAIVGTFDAVRAVNTQRARVTLTDDDMAITVFKKGSNDPTSPVEYRHSWKRINAGLETVVARGPFAPEKATAD